MARLLLAALFLYAAIFNMQLSIRNPDKYLEYAPMALPFYRRFIEGWFSHYNYIVVPLIAVGQLIISLGFLLKGWWVKWACIGAIVFLLAIAPLMVGAGFPFSIVVSIAATIVLKKDKRDYLWRRSVARQLKQKDEGFISPN
jgi:hypothetical protein